MCHICTLIILLVFVKINKSEDEKKMSVVLFLAKSSAKDSYNEDSGMKLLKFEEKTRVKHCVPEDEDSSVSLNSDCKQLLKSAIFALIIFCRNVMGMTTAVASVDNDTFSNGLRFKKSSEDLEVQYNNPRRGRSMSASNFITQPEHTEVFKIRTKRTPKRQYPDPSSLQEDTPGPGWDIFGVIANIKLTFFGKLFENDQNKRPHNDLIEQLGTISKNALFDVVKETLANLQDTKDGFLMIVLGGELSDINDIYSPLMQSVKHVLESTDEDNTLIVVTGSCPLIESAYDRTRQSLIPVFVKGPPKISSISILDQLYDVPYAIKNFLTDMNGGSYFSGVKIKRNRRALFVSSDRNKSKPAALPSFLHFSCIILLLLLTQ